jgi:Zn-dependent protease
MNMDNQSRVIGKLGSTPIIVRGLTWLPLAQLATFLGMIWYRHHRSPERPPGARVASAAMTTNAILGSEWAHNLAHLVVAHRLRKPMDELQIILGMPRCIYYDLEDIAVTPRQHILRALAGPLFNASLLPLLKRLRQTSPPGSVAHDLWDAALGMNLFLATVSLLPIPGIDGGPILKWTLVEYGQNPQQADQIVRRLNGPLAVLLGLGGLLAYLRKKRFIAVLLGLLSGTALGVFLGWIQESEILQSPRAQTGKLT